jgi:hypothetical protein
MGGKTQVRAPSIFRPSTSEETADHGITTFFVHEREQAAWAWDLAQRNLEFLRGIDVRYFLHIAEMEGQLLETESNRYAAASIRVAYGQRLETLFALISAAIQAPACVVGWMLAYRNDELEETVKAIASTAGRSTSDASRAYQSLDSFAGSVIAASQGGSESAGR